MTLACPEIHQRSDSGCGNITGIGSASGSSGASGASDGIWAGGACCARRSTPPAGENSVARAANKKRQHSDRHRGIIFLFLSTTQLNGLARRPARQSNLKLIPEGLQSDE